MNDTDLLALNVYEEAGGEIDEGKAAVARIVKNRMRAKFFSDGTIQGTVLAKDQFSWAWFGFTDGIKTASGNITPAKHMQEYVRLCYTSTEAQSLAETLLKRAKKISPKSFARCGEIAGAVMSGTYYGPLYAKLGYDAVSYLNPRILTKLPSWAIPSRLVVSIGHHDFYRATDTGALTS